jgi:hypothetical protein
MISSNTTACRNLKLHQLRGLAVEFREAILAVRHELPFKKFAAFPTQTCDHSSILLGRYLRENGFVDVQYVDKGSRGPNHETHAWLEVDGIIVDITANQFQDVSDAAIVTEDHSWHSSFYGVQRKDISLVPDNEQVRENRRIAYDLILKWLAWRPKSMFVPQSSP